MDVPALRIYLPSACGYKRILCIKLSIGIFFKGKALPTFKSAPDVINNSYDLAMILYIFLFLHFSNLIKNIFLNEKTYF